MAVPARVADTHSEAVLLCVVVELLDILLIDGVGLRQEQPPAISIGPAGDVILPAHPADATYAQITADVMQAAIDALHRPPIDPRQLLQSLDADMAGNRVCTCNRRAQDAPCNEPFRY